MANILPQQRLLLDFLIMSGDITISDDEDYVILKRSLKGCIEKCWITLNRFGASFDKAAITEEGRQAMSYCASR